MSDNKTSFWDVIKIIFFLMIALRGIVAFVLFIEEKFNWFPDKPKTEITINRNSIIWLTNYLGIKVHENHLSYIFKNTYTENNATTFDLYDIEILDTISPNNSMSIEFNDMDLSEMSASDIQRVLDNDQKVSLSDLSLVELEIYIDYQNKWRYYKYLKNKDSLNFIQEKTRKKLKNGPVKSRTEYLFIDYSDTTRFPIKVSTKLLVQETDKSSPIGLVKTFENDNLYSWLMVPLSDTSKAYIEYVNFYLDKNLTFAIGVSAKTSSSKPAKKIISTNLYFSSKTF